MQRFISKTFKFGSDNLHQVFKNNATETNLDTLTIILKSFLSWLIQKVFKQSLTASTLMI